MKIKEYISKIVSNGDQEAMTKLSDMLDESIIKLKMYDEKCYEKYKMELYELAYGETLTEEMAEEWVRNMKPMAKWTREETNNVLSGSGVNQLEGYVVMNMLYSDTSNVFGDGNTPESVEKYINATIDWLNDDDAKPHKLYRYKKYIVK